MILAALVSPYRLDPFRSVDERGEYQQASGGVQAAAMAAAVVGGIHRLHDQKTALTHLSARICRPAFWYSPSQGDLNHSAAGRGGNIAYVDGEAPLDGLVEVAQQLLERVRLCGATGDGGHLGPVASLFGLMHDDGGS